VSESVLSDHENFSEQLLAVPEEEEVLSEGETCRLLLVATEAPDMEKDGDPNVNKHSATTAMAPPAKTAPPMLENAGPPIEMRPCMLTKGILSFYIA